tara:strand:+ start:43 stop:387 length:345 start_codon:yes stop_codon:yes gene_type:complete
MDKKVKKYYDYIAKDLVKNTSFDQYADEEYGNTYLTKGGYTGIKEGLYFKFPWDAGTDHWFSANSNTMLNPSMHSTRISAIGFNKYIDDNYGAKGNEYSYIWSLYVKYMLGILM